MTAAYALLGHPVAHSRSPALHGHWFARHGIDATYRAIEVDPTRHRELRSIVVANGLRGANVTVPFKAAILAQLDQLTPLARAAGSANTLWWDGDRLCGDSTDGPGFVRALPRAPDRARPALILGSGGAGRAVAAGLAGAGWERVVLLARDPEGAVASLLSLRAAFPDTAFAAGPLGDWADLAPGAGLVVVAVSAPGRDAIRALDPAPVPSDACWCDLNYWDADPPHRATLGARFVDGRGMLIHQAALAFERWTGIAPDPADLPEHFW